MITTNQHAVSNNHLNTAQKRTLQLFKKKLAQEMPKLRIVWAQPYNDTIIELHIEYDKHTYRKSLKASKLAYEVEEKTGITMIFR